MERTATQAQAEREWMRRKLAYLDRIAALDFENRQWTAEEIRELRDFLGPWEHNIKLPHGIYTTDWAGSYPDHEEIMNVVAHHLGGDFTGKSVLDLGCLEGYFALESARHGASVVGVDGKLLNVKKCEFARAALDVDNVRFVHEDALSVTRAGYGEFDAVLVLGLLYHLDDPFTFLANVAGMCRGFAIIDTHVALVDQPEVIKGNWRVDLSDLQGLDFGGRRYQGRLYREFPAGTSQVEKDLSSTASLANDVSVWLTEDALAALLHDVGFEQVDKVVYPEDADYRWSDIRRNCRVLLVAFKERPAFRPAVL
jgi:2-polyprenyl-3-methyl-5-hydroxy-6-metoxy-1,4-benzoquinol methylase